MTETEAKTKWCPFARVGAKYDGKPVGPPINRLEKLDDDGTVREHGWTDGAMCAASACMAWRSVSSGVTGGMVIGARGEILEPGRPISGPHGYCGLAGRPE